MAIVNHHSPSLIALLNDYDTNHKFDYRKSDPRCTKFNNNMQLITSILPLVAAGSRLENMPFNYLCLYIRLVMAGVYSSEY